MRCCSINALSVFTPGALLKIDSGNWPLRLVRRFSPVKMEPDTCLNTLILSPDRTSIRIWLVLAALLWATRIVPEGLFSIGRTGPVWGRAAMGLASVFVVAFDMRDSGRLGRN